MESQAVAEGITLCFQARDITANSMQSLTTARQPRRTLPALGTAQPVSVEMHQNEFDQESSRTLLLYSVQQAMPAFTICGYNNLLF